MTRPPAGLYRFVPAIMTELAKSFEPAAIESRWGPVWAAAGAFAPTPETALLFAALLCAATDPDMVEGLATCGEQLAQVFAPLTPVPGNQ